MVSHGFAARSPLRSVGTAPCPTTQPPAGPRVDDLDKRTTASPTGYTQLTPDQLDDRTLIILGMGNSKIFAVCPPDLRPGVRVESDHLHAAVTNPAIPEHHQPPPGRGSNPPAQ